jgi:cellulose biosynthesis protein BcsQ
VSGALTRSIIGVASNITDFGRKHGVVSLIPASPRMRFNELVFEARFNTARDPREGGKEAERRIGDALSALRGYDYFVFDCAPSVAAMMQGAIRLSDVVLIPTLADAVSVYGVRTFDEAGLKIFIGVDRFIRRLVVVTKFRASPEATRHLEFLRAIYGAEFLDRPIRFSSALSQRVPPANPRLGRSLNAKYGPLTEAVKDLGRRFEERLGL